jgi:hypothetical protein
MIRKIASFKYAVFGLFSVALVSVACSDDDDAVFGGAGSAGKDGGGAGSGGKPTTAGSSSSGAATGGTNGGTSAGSATAGTTSAAGTGGTAGNAGTATTGGAGADAGGAGGASGEGGMPVGGEGGAVSGGAGGAGGEGGTPFVPDVLDNPGFEVGTSTNITGWTSEGTTGAAYIEYSASAHGGQNKLSHWTAWVNGAPDYTARTYQTVAPIANGTYSFSMWVDRDYFKTQYLFARGFNAADSAQEMTQVTDAAKDPTGYVKITLSGIPVTSGTVTVGVYSSVETGTYANFDDAELVLE